MAVTQKSDWGGHDLLGGCSKTKAITTKAQTCLPVNVNKLRNPIGFQFEPACWP